MPITDEYTRLPINHISARRDERQRRRFNEIELQALQDSIRQIGLINPLVVRQDGDVIVLVAGERRLIACQRLNHETVPIRWAHELSEAEAGIIELEENIKREDLDWRDCCRAVAKLHELHRQIDPSWSQVKTAQSLSLSPGMVSQYLRVFPELDTGLLTNANSISQALNGIDNRDRRRAQHVLEHDLQIPTEVPRVNGEVPSPGGAYTYQPPIAGELPQSRHASRDILNASFLEWAPRYDGPRFNLIHCDFPYGSTSVGPQMQGAESEFYEDNPDIYYELVECLCNNFDRLLTNSGHLLFWYSERLGPWTRDIFAHRLRDLDLQVHPLIWVHTDGAGISPDPRRRPRHVYDTCLFGSRGDSLLIQVAADAYGSPTDRSLHPSTKPVPMLKHFFTMMCDQYTSLLDPTCGSGTALRAAEGLGANRVLGLEINPSYCEAARSALQADRDLRVLTEGAL